jgi:hypothetical protein
MCKVNAAMIVADGQAVGTALDQLAVALTTADPSLAASLAAAGNAIVAATQNWKDGNTLTTIEDAEQAAIAVLNAIPLTSPYAGLVAIAFAALNILIANSQTQPTPAAPVTSAKALLKKADSLNTESPWHGKANIEHEWYRTPRKDFEAAWNSTAKPLGVGTVSV